MKSSEYVKSLGIELTDEQVAAIDDRMRVVGSSKVDKKYALVEDDEIKEKIGGIKTTQKKLLAMSLLKTDEPVDQSTWADLAIEEGLNTRQDPTRIVAYYKKSLVDAGIVREVQ